MNNEKPTIIHVFSHRPNPVCLNYKTPEEFIEKHDNAGFIKIDKYPYWIGFFQDFSHKISTDILKVTDKYNHECWRPYFSFLDKKYEKVFDGVLHRVYPSRSFRVPKVDRWLWSKGFLEDLRKRIEKNEKILLHLHDGHSNFITWLMLKLKPLNVPVLYQHRGGWFSIFDYTHRRKNPVYLLNFKRQKELFQYITYYYSGSKIEYEFIINNMEIKNISYYMDGVDFDYFIPGDKVEARRKLNLPQDKIILINVGRLDKVNGADNLVNMFVKLKKDGYNVELLFVGGYKNNPSYNLAKEAGAILVERVHEHKLRDYYQASDIYILPISDYFYRNFAGFGSTPIQALACGLPILSYNIIHLPGTEEEINKIGKIFSDEQDLYEKAKYMIENINEFKNCREVAKKYYDKKVTIKNLINKYGELFSKYYLN